MRRIYMCQDKHSSAGYTFVSLDGRERESCTSEFCPFKQRLLGYCSYSRNQCWCTRSTLLRSTSPCSPITTDCDSTGEGLPDPALAVPRQLVRRADGGMLAGHKSAVCPANRPRARVGCEDLRTDIHHHLCPHINGGVFPPHLPLLRVSLPSKLLARGALSSSPLPYYTLWCWGFAFSSSVSWRRAAIQNITGTQLNA